MNPKSNEQKKVRDGESRVRAIVFSAAFRSFRVVKMLPRSFFFAVLAGFYPRRATRAGPIFSRVSRILREREREREKRKKKKEFVRNENTCLVDDDVSIFDPRFFSFVCVCVCVDSLLLTFTSSI